MFEQFVKWLRALIGSTKDPLAKLDPLVLSDQVKLLDIERNKAVEALERKESLRVELKNRAQQEVRSQVAGTQSVRLLELARQISYLDEEISDRRDYLSQIHQQRRTVSQFLRFAERAELMRRYGLDKILGRHVDLGVLEKAIENSVSGGVLYAESLSVAENLLQDALASTRTEIDDLGLLRVLDEIAGVVQPDNVSAEPDAATSQKPIEVDVRAVLQELERDS